MATDWKGLVGTALVAAVGAVLGGGGTAAYYRPTVAVPQCTAMREMLRDYASKHQRELQDQGVSATFSCGYGDDSKADKTGTKDV